MSFAARYRALNADPIPHNAAQAREFTKRAEIEKARVDAALESTRRETGTNWRGKRDAINALRIASMRQANLIETYRQKLVEFELVESQG